jgi:predicted NBD/HSP70 family sugar kinase
MDKNCVRRPTRHLTQQKIIKLLCLRETINQVDISQEISVSPPTVISNINELVSVGMLQIGGVGLSRGGRKPLIVEVNPNFQYTIGTDFLCDSVKVVVFNFKMEAIARKVIAIGKFLTFDEVMDKLIVLMKDILLSNNITISKLLGVGISIPGVVNENTKRIEIAPNLHITNAHLRKYNRIFGRPVYFENEANAASYAEWQSGAAQGSKNVLYVSITKGVGAGIIINNRLYRGSYFKAGEVGHIVIRRDGRKCVCGENGCLNEYISVDSILREYSKKTRKKLHHLADFMALKSRGDAVANRIWEDYVDDFAFGLRTMIFTVDPQIIVIGGEIARYADILIPALSHKLSLTKSHVFKRNNKIIPSKLMEDASVIGVALYLRNRFIRTY